MYYSIVVEETPGGFVAYSPELKGCVAVGPSREEAEGLIQEAIELHQQCILGEM